MTLKNWSTYKSTMPTLKEGEKFFREFGFNRESIDEDARTVELSFSSTEPYSRWFGTEILEHKKGSVDLKRLRNGGALLLNHDRDQQIGVIESARIDSADEKGRAVVRFGNSTLAKEIFQDVIDGIRRLVSVGYIVKKTVTEDNEDGPDIVRVTKWEPLEVSIVSIPADTTVGVGRSAEIETQNKNKERQKNMPDGDTITGVPIQGTKAAETQLAPVAPVAPQVQVSADEIRKAEVKRCSEISQMGAKYNCPEDAKRFMNEGKSPDEFGRWILDNDKRTTATTEPGADQRDAGGSPEIGMTKKEVENYSIVRAINSFIENKRFEGFEAEVSQTAKKQYGRRLTDSDCLTIPTEVLRKNLQRTLDVGTAADGGNLVGTDLRGSSFIDILRNASVIAQTGATYLNDLVGNVDIPRQSGAATAYWTTEEGATTASDQQFDQVALSPKTLSALTIYSKMLMAQSSVDIENMVRRDLATVLAVAQDKAAIEGTGAANQPTGIWNQGSVNTVTKSGNYHNDTVFMEREVDTDNALLGTLSYVTNSKLKAKLKTQEVSSNTARFVYMDGEVNGYPCHISNQVAATYNTNADSGIIFGNWIDLIIANWAGLDVVVDPFTLSNTRQVRIVTSMFTDIAVRHPESFCKAELTH